MKIIAKEYEKHYHNLTIIGEEKQIKYLIENFTNAMEIINGLEASVKQEEETKKKLEPHWAQKSGVHVSVYTTAQAA